MPVYEYECREHGTFEEIRPMHRSREGADCPECHGAAPRVLSPTRTALVPRAAGIAHARNEKSRHSPEVCTHPHGHGGPLSKKPPLPERQRGAAQVYRGQRPWVMEHG